MKTQTGNTLNKNQGKQSPGVSGNKTDQESRYAKASLDDRADSANKKSIREDDIDDVNSLDDDEDDVL